MSGRIRKSVAALSAYVPGEQPADPSIIKLNTNENPYPPSPKVAEAIAALDPSILRLYPDPVCLELREAIAARHGCRPEQVFVGNGSDEVLALSLRAFVERDGAVGYFEPSYSLYPILADIEDVKKCPTELAEGFAWSTPRGPVDLFFLTSPNAPTSLPFPRPEVEAYCAEAKGVVLVDEAYGDFADDDFMDLALGRDNVLVSRSLSKSYSLAGIRVGYAVGPVPLIEALFKIKDSYNVDCLSQIAARAAIEDEGYLVATVAMIRTTRERVAVELVELGYEVTPSATNFLWVRPPDGDAEGVFRMLREKKILVRYFPGPATGAYLRITVGTDREMDALIATLSSNQR